MARFSPPVSILREMHQHDFPHNGGRTTPPHRPHGQAMRRQIAVGSCGWRQSESLNARRLDRENVGSGRVYFPLLHACSPAPVSRNLHSKQQSSRTGKKCSFQCECMISAPRSSASESDDVGHDAPAVCSDFKSRRHDLLFRPRDAECLRMALPGLHGMFDLL